MLPGRATDLLEQPYVPPFGLEEPGEEQLSLVREVVDREVEHATGR